MTTIAFDGKTLATDSLVTSGSTALGNVAKIHKLKDGRHIAFSGTFAAGPLVLEWLNGGPKPEMPKGCEFAALIVDKQGKAFYLDDHLSIVEMCVPWAGGSGEAFALAAMTLGKSAVEAVELACKLDINSGGPVQLHTIAGKRCR